MTEYTRVEEIAKELEQDVPAGAITQRNKLDYVTGRYIKQRLNEIFGWQGWGYEVISERIITLDENCVRWFAHVRLTTMCDDGHTVQDGMAVGHGLLTKEVWEGGRRTGRFEPVSAGRANEIIDFAAAEAVTDALKRAAVRLGQNLGLSLYPYAKGSKEAPHEIAETPVEAPELQDDHPLPQNTETAATSLLDGFSRRLGEANSLEELKQVWVQVQAAPLSQEQKHMLETIKDMSKDRVG
jgi:recombination DNA repair RAD52 pathway protein